MSTFYMVEMDFPYPDERAGFDEFYNAHVSKLLTIDGFLSAQRFECVHHAVSPFFALYQLEDDGVLERPSYRARGGPNSVSESYKPRIRNWDRNLLQGPDVNLDVPMGGWIVVIDRKSDDSPPIPDGYDLFVPVGLDRTVTQRGIRVGAAGEPDPPKDVSPGWTIRTMLPLHPRRSP